jgi:hypothetical protein
MFLLYFNGEYHEYYHGAFEHKQWFEYTNFRAGESFWMVPGTCEHEWEF